MRRYAGKPATHPPLLVISDTAQHQWTPDQYAEPVDIMSLHFGAEHLKNKY
jgi:hypothetical protein